MFLSPASASAAGADRPAAAPMMARGLFLLNARFGKVRFESILTAAEQMAREGTPASRALVRDLAVVAGPLAADPGARAVFFPGGKMIAEGDPLVQPELSALIAQLRRAGVGDLYAGALATQFAAAASQAGGGISTADLRAALPKVTPALMLDGPGESTVSFLPTPADGGLAAAAAYRVLAADLTANDAAKARAIAAAAEFRRTGVMGEAILNSNPPPASMPSLPASTSLAVIDRDGNAVTCALTMGNLFGTGRIAPGTGILLAASPAAQPPPLLAAGMVTYRRNSALRVVAGGSGQDGAPVAVARALATALADRGKVARLDPAGAPEPGRVNVIACNGSANTPESCGWATDPRGFGLATGSN
jgi:gamma-glutamyltranspeptidase/glutathione hydrolase